MECGSSGDGEGVNCWNIAFTLVDWRLKREMLGFVSYTEQFHFSNGNLWHMPLQKPINTHFVLERDEFGKASRFVLRNLPPKIKWAGYVQCGLLIALMLTGAAFRPGGKLQPVSLVILILVWLVFLTGQIAHRAGADLRFAPMAGREIWYEFDETGLRCGLPNAESRLNWPAISSFIETDALFVVVESGVLYYTIPKRALAADDVSSLRQLLMEKVSARA